MVLKTATETGSATGKKAARGALLVLDLNLLGSAAESGSQCLEHPFDFHNTFSD
jgi:hypothetical protein